MDHLLDTNILLRWVQRNSFQNAMVRQALKNLYRNGDRLFVTPQNFIEFWNVATRPVKANGLGLTPMRADFKLRRLERLFHVAPDTPQVYAQWRHLVVIHGVAGVQVHDTRLVAVMLTHGITHLLTLDSGDFQRFPITVVHPRDV